MSQRCLLSAAVAKRAIEFRVAMGLSFENPCDIYEAISEYGIDLQFVDIPSLEGMYLEEPEARRICVSAHRPVGRQHYTAAHELGHHLLGHGSQFDTVVGDLGQVKSLTPEERAADAFARYVRMLARRRVRNPPQPNVVLAANIATLALQAIIKGKPQDHQSEANGRDAAGRRLAS